MLLVLFTFILNSKLKRKAENDSLLSGSKAKRRKKDKRKREWQQKKIEFAGERDGNSVMLNDAGAVGRKRQDEKGKIVDHLSK